MGATVLAGFIGAVSAPLGWALSSAIVLLLAPLAVRGTVMLPATVRLRRTGPPGRHLYVHSVASTRPGAGAELLASLATEADQKGWSLVLDADNKKLETYYVRFGFARSGRTGMPARAGRVRMWRQPQDRERT
jgi:hypothetical protein